MGAGGRRDELIALVALVAVAAAIVIGGVLTQSGGDAGPAADPSPASSTPTGSPGQSPTDTPSAAPVGAGVTVADAPFVYACRLVAPADVARIFGSSGSRGYVRQQYLDRTPTDEELAGANAFAYGGVSTRCTHWFDDAAGDQLDVVVTQFPSEKLVQKRLDRLTRGTGSGKRRQPPAARVVDGTDRRLLYVVDERSFLISADDLTVEAHFTDRRLGKQYGPLTDQQHDAQVPLMKQVLAAVDRHVADGTAVEGPLATSAGATTTVGGTPYVEPCDVLDEPVFDTLGGPPAEPVVVDTSVIAHDPFADAAVASCERTGSLRDGGPRQVSSTFAVLELRVAPDPTGALKVMKRHIDARYGKKATPIPIETDVGTAYVVNLPTSRSDPQRTRAVHVAIGPYELRLTVVRDVSRQHPAGQAPTGDQLTAAVAAMADALSAATGDVP